MLFEKIKEILVDVLGVEESDVTEDANLINDLAAESIDFMDLAYQIEQKLEIPEVTPAKLFPVFLVGKQVEDIFENGKMIPEISKQLKEEYPFLSEDKARQFEKDQTPEIFFDISTLLDFIKFYQKQAL